MGKGILWPREERHYPVPFPFSRSPDPSILRFLDPAVISYFLYVLFPLLQEEAEKNELQFRQHLQNFYGGARETNVTRGSRAKSQPRDRDSGNNTPANDQVR